MGDIDAYLFSLNKLTNDLDKVAADIIRKNSKYILATIKRRLWNTGIDAVGNKIMPDYAVSTIKVKKIEGKRSSHVTLKDEGDFYNSMFLTIEQNKLIVGASDHITSTLISKYGPDILGLTEQEQRDIVDLMIEPEIIKILSALPDIGL